MITGDALSQSTLGALVLASLGALQDLPSAAHWLVGGVLLVGLVLWLFGRRLLKPAFALLGLVSGGLLGFLLLPAVAPATIVGVPSPYLGLGLGAVLGLIQGLAFFRFAMAIAAAAMLALAAGIGSAAFMKFEPLRHAAEVARQPVSTISPLTPAGLSAAPDDARGPVVERLQPVAQKVTGFLEELWGTLRDEWAKLTTRQQAVIVLSTLVGAGAGLVAGLIFPKRSSAALTALLGAAVWLPAAAWLLIALDTPLKGSMDQPAIVWLGVWGALAAIGLALQMTVLRPGQSKPAE